uniref:Ribosome production factor 2 homolog n=1 Tax=Arcella intermedia TaxID=1963864 RepID=A0A6B2LAR3_9EUKA
MKRKEPQVFENVKVAMFIKGHKTSQVVNEVLNDLYSLKKPEAVKYNRKKSNSLHGPFEELTTIEFFSNKSDASLFVYGSSSKKRPDTIVLGRLFDFHLLDMVELGVKHFKAVSSFNSAGLPFFGSKPCFVISGPEFLNDSKYMLIANMFVDFFRGKIVESINLKGLDHVIALSVDKDGAILFRHYAITMKKSDTKVPTVELDEIGPALDLLVRRQQFGAEALRNEALRVPKELKPKKVKNVSTNPFHDKVGTVHVQPQMVDKIHDKVRKPKALRKRSISEAGEEEAAPMPKSKKKKVQ